MTDLPDMGPQPFFVVCQTCFVRYEFLVDPEGFARWQQGVHIQNALPDNTPAERELILTKTCEPCFDKMFPEDDE